MTQLAMQDMSAFFKLRKLNLRNYTAGGQLSTESRLKVAIGIFRKLGFVEVPVLEHEYARVDVMMELEIRC